jgi:hypothetical protein
MQVLKFDVRFPDGRVEELRLDSDRATIGSGGHCEIRLPVDQAAVEHVAIQLTPGGVFAEARTFQPPPTVNGSPFTRTQLVPGSVLGVGQVQIYATAAEIMGADGAQKKEQKTSPLTIVMALVVMPLALWMIFQDEGGEGVGVAPKEIPELWDAPTTTCTVQGKEGALSRAWAQFAKAASKQERRPFHIPDGVQAVPSYEESAACFQAGGDIEQAKRVSATGAKLRKDVAEDFRTHRVRLEHAIATKKYETAQKEVKVLLAFLDGKEGDYVNWLSALERKLRLKYGDDKRANAQKKKT